MNVLSLLTNTGELRYPLHEWLGINSVENEEMSLMKMNDAGVSFELIADIIEKGI